jgi:hypothetical protein
MRTRMPHANAGALVLLAALGFLGSPAPSRAQTIQEQAAQCEVHLGDIPALKCTEGHPLPVLQDGVEVPEHLWSETMKCDAPPVLFDVGEGKTTQCVPRSQIQLHFTQTSSGDKVQWALLCRKYSIDRAKEKDLFDDVALIGHNQKTGATCFFQALASEQPHHKALDGAAVPKPSESTADEFWLEPANTAGKRCYSCHDNDPWIHTPYVDQVPAVKKDLKDATGPYKFVSEPFESSWPHPRKFDWAQKAQNECIGCHRFGVGNSSNDFTVYSADRRSSRLDYFFPWITASRKQWPYSHWMPQPMRKGVDDPAKWNTAFEQAYELIRLCQAHPDSKTECKTKPVKAQTLASLRGLSFDAGIQACGEAGVRVEFASGVPYRAAAFLSDACYCGVMDGISHTTARDDGWRARLDGDRCVCGFEPGSAGDNACAVSP